jgi:hypothetical protein
MTKTADENNLSIFRRIQSGDSSALRDLINKTNQVIHQPPPPPSNPPPQEKG